MAKKWVAVEQHDDSECDPCSAIDGTTYANRADAYADYPGGVGYKDCIGAEFGNACRGRVQKRRAKNHQGDQGMTDVSLLREFRARLAERAAIQPAALKPAAPKGKDWFRIENLSADEASIYIFDEIGMWGTSAQGFVDQLNAVTSPKITVYLNSPGGEVFDGIAIHTALAMSKAHVTTFVTGVAASAASFIAMAGDTIKMARNATMMIHEASGLAWGNKRTMRQEADLLEKLDGNIADMYAMQAGGEVADWLAAMEAETWYTGQEALAAGPRGSSRPRGDRSSSGDSSGGGRSGGGSPPRSGGWGDAPQFRLHSTRSRPGHAPAGRTNEGLASHDRSRYPADRR
jgi:ATP-dependent protease ClpP protease subunit